MKINRLFSIAAAALMMVACSSEETALKNNPAVGSQMPFTATIAVLGSGAGTRTAYTESGTDINVTWSVGDEIALIHNGVKDVATVKTINADGSSATITGFITKAENGDGVEVCYPAALWEWNDEAQGAIRNATFVTNIGAQGGTLNYIQENLDVRMAKGQLKVDGDNATISASATLESQIAIWKLSLLDGESNVLQATQVKIKGETSVLASTATIAATSEVTLAIPTDVAIDGALTIEATVGSDTYAYTKEEGVTFYSKYYQSKVMMEKPWDGNLATVTKNVTATDGTTIYGTLGKNVMISIADGATVTLDGVTINGNGIGDQQCDWAGITCEGDANIILKDGSTNTVTGFNWSCPGIYVPENKTLTIKGETSGTGKLTASSCKQGNGAGIGGGMFINCGNIEIQGGVITAYGGDDAAGIGSANNSSCGSITISGGTVNATSDNDGAGIGTGHTGTCTTITISGGTVVAKSGDRGAGIGSGFQGTCGNISISGGTVEATGGANAAGIGTGQYGTCGNITITDGVTSVAATKGTDAPNSIGAGVSAVSCGTVTIGGVVGAISTSPYTYPVPIELSAVTSSQLGWIVGNDGKAYAVEPLPAGVDAVAKICYVGDNGEVAPNNHGLALALTDESSSGMKWEAAKTACNTTKNTSIPVTNARWLLASKDQWGYMSSAVLSNLGLQNKWYWSSTIYSSEPFLQVWAYQFSNNSWDQYNGSNDGVNNRVRACLAF